MKKEKFGIAAALLFIMLMMYTVNGAGASVPVIDASACALIEISTGRVLYENNGTQSMPMASTTKIMTALVVLERVSPSDVVVIPKSASGIEGSSIYLEPDERLTVEQLLYGLLLRSGNDAAVALAQYVGGSVGDFAALMNAKADELGLTGTRYVNPHGLPAEGHYTTAIDMARVMAAAMDYELFREIIATEKTRIPWDGHPWDRVLTNKNKLLTTMDGALGGKTGFTKEAGRCLVEACERDGMELVSVVLRCPDWWNQSEKLLNYGFSAYSMEPLLFAGDFACEIDTGGYPEALELLARGDLTVPLRKDEEPIVRLLLGDTSLPINVGQNLALAVAEVDGQSIAAVPLCARQSARSNAFGDVLRRVFGGWIN